MAITEEDALASRVARLEERISAIERQLGHADDVAPAVAPSVARDVPLFDFARLARSVLMVGGAYLLRALTELHVVPERAGIVLAFLYAMALLPFDAPTGALIAAGLIWEATTRFHALSPIAAAALTMIVSLALMKSSARIAAVMTVITLTGLAIGTGDLLPPAIAATLAGVIAFRLRRDALSTTTLAVASDFFAIALVVMTALDRTPHSRLAVEFALVAIAAAWLLTNPLQAAFAVVIGAGGASLFAFDAGQLAVVWGVAAVVAALVSRLAPHPAFGTPLPVGEGVSAALIPLPPGEGGAERRVRGAFVCRNVAITFAVASLVAAFFAGGLQLLVVAICTAISFVLITQDAIITRTAMLAIATASILATLQSALALTSLHRSLILAAAAILFALPRRRESAIVARILLGAGAIQLLVEATRASAATMVVALAGYGIAMLIVARRRVTV